MVLAAAASGLFAGSALYASVVESRAVLSRPGDGARAQFVRQFRPAGAFQAPLVLVGTLAGVTAALMSRDGLTIAAAAVMAIVVVVTRGRHLPPQRAPAAGGQWRRGRWARDARALVPAARGAWSPRPRGQRSVPRRARPVNLAAP